MSKVTIHVQARALFSDWSQGIGFPVVVEAATPSDAVAIFGVAFQRVIEREIAAIRAATQSEGEEKS